MKKYLNDERIDNTWSVIELTELPDNMPILAISEYPDKSFAEFHLVKYCLIPKRLLVNKKAKLNDAGNQNQTT